MKKILILVQACDDAPYLEMNKKQMSTWDSIKVEGVETIYYLGSNDGVEKLEGNKYYSGTSEAWNMMHWRMKKTLDLAYTMEWDYIFRTNSSSYVDKKRLQRFAEKLPTEKCYCGIDGGFASGAGFFMSRDIMEILKDKLDEYPTYSEDACMGTILAKQGIGVTEGAERCDYYFTGISHRSEPYYHFRCKSDTIDRQKDIDAFEWLFKNNTEK